MVTLLTRHWTRRLLQYERIQFVRREALLVLDGITITSNSISTVFNASCNRKLLSVRLKQLELRINSPEVLAAGGRELSDLFDAVF